MPERTAYKTDENGNVVPFTYIAPAAPNPMQEQQKLIDQAYRDLPLEQAEQAAMAAMVYQGRRGYARDLENGLSAPEALSKWAPLMFPRNPAQGAALVRAMPQQHKLVFTPIPGTKGQVVQVGDTFKLLKPEKIPQAAVVKEVTRNGRKMLETTQPNGFVTYRDVTEKPTGITPEKAAAMEQARNIALINAATKLSDMDQKSEAYNVTTNAMANLKRPISVGQPQSTAAPITQANPVVSKVTTKQEFDAVPSGTIYIGKDGKRYRKP